MNEWIGRHLGERTVSYDERDVILYALAVGATTADLDLVFEERLRVLPTFALTQAQWAPDVLGSLGAFDIRTAVHGSQRLRSLKPLPPTGELTMAARVTQVWDKGSAAIFEVEVVSDYFVATWSLFAPGCGGFGGDRGPSAPRHPETAPTRELSVATSPNQAALYRLLGDRHHMHIDPEAAKAAGMPRPFLHGLCTVAAVTLPLAEAAGAHPADLAELEGRFASPVFPGDRLDVRCWESGEAVLFDAAVDGTTVLSGGRAHFRVTT
ncbi:MaoC/PaaZ C-terminal domain-containing protein [Sphaerimonospora thailandensis]|uniref:3-alpha,7-alpha,12-alpha-trihydroxy-5-beta-choles t-24-enoyl-CoA hydratase n=1 Tax=Sphaerimonospora thailandensis TaxID=795644 RepID=A0A8J3RCL1_9ACTN|nr:MaoC/PaaZ C-terminal domain-containing protein [Sphaerimonospora thailandensis]GIH71397.1 3-alpha,7-alpha,12-alpha-trihydroxy-5-beta-choles t-24-enoyl-CoA hydratase [Sphaerimonospora thailandensis]